MRNIGDRSPLAGEGDCGQTPASVWGNTAVRTVNSAFLQNPALVGAVKKNAKEAVDFGTNLAITRIKREFDNRLLMRRVKDKSVFASNS